MSSDNPLSNHPGLGEVVTSPLFSHRLDALVRAERSVDLSPVDSAAFAMIAAACAHQTKDSTSGRVWLSHPHPRVRERIATEVSLWGVRPVFLPDLPDNPDEQSSIAPETLAARLSIIQLLSKPHAGNKPQLVILSPEALESHCPKPENLNDASLPLALGDEISPQDLVQQLRDNEYEQVSQVYAHGQFAQRGGILDLFCWQAPQPVRMEFFDTELESLRLFDVDSQLSIRKLSQLELTIAQPEETGIVRELMHENDRLLSVDLAELPGAHGTMTDASANAHQAPLCAGSPLGSFDAGDFILNEARRHRFFQQVAEWTGDDWQVFITFSNKGEKERFTELVDGEFFTHKNITAISGELVQGFTVPSAKVAFLSSAELFGRYQNPGSRISTRREDVQTRARKQTALEDIRKGDLVVHAEYGIGRFRGIERDDEGLEEIHIHYRDGAILSVPLDHSHLLSKYVGLGGKDPELNKLGSTAWSKARSKAEKSILDYAAKLLQLQAQRQTQPGFTHPPDTRWMWEFENSFHFQLTPGQRDAIADVKRDMESDKPMDRLICGDVGFGKTEVAIRAAFKAATSGKQAVVLVPTTVLAEQHWRTFRERMSDYPIRIELLNRFRKPAEVKATINDLASGAVDIVIGTHRLLSKDVSFKDLGVAIIDEEQRFGVKHKERFKEMFQGIDVLTLSATPIPRTLYLSLMGARDMSTIDTPLPGKVPIHTSIHGYDERIIRQAILRELKRGGQVFFLHNRVKSIEMVRKKLRHLIPDASIVVGHGQMEKDELEVVMRTFVQGKADILLATTIIESGIDIPNANTIIIDRADRFGLADLYQLRGRVGRAGGQAYAVLMLPSDLIHGDARKRIDAIRQYTALGSGFKIAMRDLEIRGAGNLLGTRQSGHIAAVGFDLYCQLLRQSIDQLRDGKTSQRVDVTLRSDFLCFNEGEFATSETASLLPCYIPANYMPEARLRISAYRELAELIQLRELDTLESRWIDRFGPLPAPAHHLLQTTRLKLLASAASITSIEIREQRLMLTRNGQFIKPNRTHFPRLSQTAPEQKLHEAVEMLTSL